jgi:hypothetical protein
MWKYHCEAVLNSILEKSLIRFVAGPSMYYEGIKKVLDSAAVEE